MKNLQEAYWKMPKEILLIYKIDVNNWKNKWRLEQMKLELKHKSK